MSAGFGWKGSKAEPLGWKVVSTEPDEERTFSREQLAEAVALRHLWWDVEERGSVAFIDLDAQRHEEMLRFTSRL
jgi:hypothetical protein